MSATTVGTLTWADGQWGIAAQPNVMMRAKRVFPRVRTTTTSTIYVQASDEVARDIEWFTERFPLAMDAPTKRRLRQSAAAHREREEAVNDILRGGSYQAPTTVLGDPAMVLRPYQESFVAMIARTRRMLLGDEYGVGKTISAGGIFALEGALPALVVTPASTLPVQWKERMAQMWPMLTSHIVTGTTPYALDAVGGLAGPPDILITTYSRLAGWVDALDGQVGTVVFDEVQDLRNGTGTEKGKAAARLAASAKYVAGLSATPSYNYGNEWWNLYDVIAPGALGNEGEFSREWGGAFVGPGKQLVTDPLALGTHLRSEGLLLARSRKEVGRQIADPIPIVHEVESDPAVLDAISGDVEAIANLILSDTADRKEKFTAGGQLDWKLRQATGVAKAPFVAEYVRMLLETEEKVVLWGWHREVYAIWQERLAEFNPVMFTGSESTTAKKRSQDAFLLPNGTPGASRVLIMSLRSGSGLDDLQNVCSEGVFGEMDWSRKVHGQCINRLRRDGQKSVVREHWLVSQDGSDPVIAETLNLKDQQSNPVMNPDAPAFEVIDSPAEQASRVRLLAAAAIARRARTTAPPVLARVEPERLVAAEPVPEYSLFDCDLATV